jgi:hypothetical protein
LKGIVALPPKQPRELRSPKYALLSDGESSSSTGSDDLRVVDHFTVFSQGDVGTISEEECSVEHIDGEDHLEMIDFVNMGESSDDALVRMIRPNF